MEDLRTFITSGVRNVLAIIKFSIIWLFATLSNDFTVKYIIDKTYKLICHIKIRVNNTETKRRVILEWVRNRVGEKYAPKNFGDDWKDGITLCALIERIIPGNCPRYDLLQAKQGIENINLGLSLIRKCFNFEPIIDAQSIYNCTADAELVYLLSRLKLASAKLIMKNALKRPMISVNDAPDESKPETELRKEEECFAKGMGLILAVRGRRACFNIFCRPNVKLNLMIEIIGPNNSMCSEKIISHMPKKRNLENTKTSMTALIEENTNNSVKEIRKASDDRSLKIPFNYEVFQNKISVTYIPIATGKHKLSIIWQGQHIMKSPYTVIVDDSNEIADFDSSSLSKKLTSTLPLNNIGNNEEITALLNNGMIIKSKRIIKKTIVSKGKERGVFVDNKSKSSSSECSELTNDESIINQPKAEEEFNENLLQNNDTEIGLNDDNQLNNKENGIFSNNKDEENNNESNKINANEIESDIKVNHIEEEPIIVSVKSYELENVNKNEEQSYASVNGTEHETNESNSVLTNKDKEMIDNDIAKCYLNSTSFLPVSNMIERWETALYNERREINYNRNKIKRLNSQLVKSRRKMFEERDTKSFNDHEDLFGANPKRMTSQFSISDTKQFWEELTSKGIRTEHTKMTDDCDYTDSFVRDNSDIDAKQMDKECQFQGNDNDKEHHPNLSILMSNEILDRPKQTDILRLNFLSVSTPKSPESHTDSGISLEQFFHYDIEKSLPTQSRLTLMKSNSYPQLNQIKNFNFKDSEDSIFDLNKTHDIKPSSKSIGDITLSIGGHYIDDEIPDYASLYLGDYVSFSGLLNTDKPKTFCDIQLHDQLNSAQTNQTNDGIHPDKCQIFGAGLYYGQVAVKNHFLVSTKSAGKSFLVVGIQGAELDDVTEVVVTYIGENTYEVMYEVTRPGYYLIFVKWGDENIPDSPFICKVTY